MKLFIVSAASLLLGCAIGCGLGFRYVDVAHALDVTESTEAVQAARDVRVIECIDSGESQRAVRLLSSPIADYYCLYKGRFDPRTNGEQRRKTCSLIEDLIKTNKIVAAEITNQMALYGSAAKSPKE